MLELKGVSTSFGKRLKMLKDVNLKVGQGEMVCLLGSNGSGKTTTLRTIIGLIKPDQGEVLFKGRRIDRMKTYDIINSGISIAAEGRRLFPKMTVLENMRICLKKSQDPSRFDELAADLFKLFPVLKERRSQLAGTLSGGEQAMLSISRALIQEPELLILDEPSFGLAPILVEQFYQTIDQIRKQGKTILLSEQNAGKALAMSDRGYVLQKGVVNASGSCRDLMENDIVRECYLGS